VAQANRSALAPVHDITRAILVLRGQRVLLDADLADLYGVTTRRLNEQVRRNRGRFPNDFLFELTAEEFGHLKSHFATSSWGGRRKLPLAFTEHGAIMTATILNSPRAIEMSVYIVRAFVSAWTTAVPQNEYVPPMPYVLGRTRRPYSTNATFGRWITLSSLSRLVMNTDTSTLPHRMPPVAPMTK
jgi:hypothetical protein